MKTKTIIYVEPVPRDSNRKLKHRLIYRLTEEDSIFLCRNFQLFDLVHKQYETSQLGGEKIIQFEMEYPELFQLVMDWCSLGTFKVPESGYDFWDVWRMMKTDLGVKTGVSWLDKCVCELFSEPSKMKRLLELE